jgi:hypothetical protein
MFTTVKIANRATVVLLFDDEGLSSGVSASEEDNDLSGLDELDHGR